MKVHIPLNPTDYLLLQLLQPDHQSQTLSPEGIDWNGFLRRAAQLGLVSLVTPQLNRLGSSTSDASKSVAAIPEKVHEEFRRIYSLKAQRSLQQYLQLSQALLTLSAAGVPVIVLKGAYLAQVVYRNVALRPMNDLDILIRLENLNTAEAALAACGYQVVSGQEHFHHRLERGTEEATVELHWDLAPPPPAGAFRMALDGIWARAEAIQLTGVSALALSPEDNLVYLCIHAAYHHLYNFYALRLLYDLAIITRVLASRLNPQIVSQRAEEWGARQCVYLTLRLARELLGEAGLDPILEVLEPERFDERLLGWAEERIFHGEGSEPTSQNAGPKMSGRFAAIWTSTRPTKTLAAGLNAMFPTRATLAALYNLPAGSRQIYLYYLVRLKDLGKRHASKSWRFLRRDVSTLSWMEQEGKRAALVDWITASQSDHA